jgi:hypothetical protein
MERFWLPAAPGFNEGQIGTNTCKGKEGCPTPPGGRLSRPEALGLSHKTPGLGAVPRRHSSCVINISLLVPKADRLGAPQLCE